MDECRPWQACARGPAASTLWAPSSATAQRDTGSVTTTANVKGGEGHVDTRLLCALPLRLPATQGRRPGWGVLAPTWHVCTDVDQGLSTPGFCSRGSCTNTAGSYVCLCPCGFASSLDSSRCLGEPGGAAGGRIGGRPLACVFLQLAGPQAPLALRSLPSASLEVFLASMPLRASSLHLGVSLTL